MRNTCTGLHKEKNVSQQNDDMLVGAEEIADFMKCNKRQAFYLLERRLIPSFKIGARWHARISTLNAHFAKLEAGDAA